MKAQGTGIRVILSPHLPSGTVMASADVYDAIKAAIAASTPDCEHGTRQWCWECYASRVSSKGTGDTPPAPIEAAGQVIAENGEAGVPT